MAACSELNESLAKLIQKSSSAELSKLTHRLAEQECGHQRAAYSDFSKLWSLEEWWEVTSALCAIFKDSVKRDWTKDEVFQTLGSLADDYKTVVMETITVHREAIRQALLLQSAAISPCVLSDFDWQLKLAMSSDHLASLQQPLLQLDLSIQSQDDQRETVSMELDPDSLKRLIASLEGANKAVQQLTT